MRRYLSLALCALLAILTSRAAHAGVVVGPGLSGVNGKISKSDGTCEAKDYLACDGSTDDSTALNNALKVGGACVDKVFHVPVDCNILLASPGTTNPSFLMGGSARIKCDGNGPQDGGIYLARKVCSGGTTPGAGCTDGNECTGGSCVTIGGGQYAPTAGQTYTIAKSDPSSDPDLSFPGIEGCGFHIFGTSGFGTCANGDAQQTKACRGYCNDDSVLRGMTCTQNSECVTGTCNTTQMVCGTSTNCTAESDAPSGEGNVKLVSATTPFIFKNNRVYNAKRLANSSVGANSLIENNDSLVFDSKPITPNTVGSYNNFAVTYALDGWTTGNYSRFRENKLNVSVSGGIGIKVGYYSQIDSNSIDVLPQSGSSTTYGIWVDGENSAVNHNSLRVIPNNAVTGATYGIYSTKSWVTVGGNTIKYTGGATSTAIQAAIATTGASVTGNWWSITNGAYGWYGSAGTLTGNSGYSYGGWRGHVWVVAAAGNQTTVTGNTLSGGGYCMAGPGINASFSGNRCMNANAGIVLTTGWLCEDNYIAWIGTTQKSAAVWLGYPTSLANERCTAASTPWGCCSGADAGTCDDVAGYGNVHFILTTNLIHTGVVNTSLVKAPDGTVGTDTVCESGGNIGVACAADNNTACPGATCPNCCTVPILNGLISQNLLYGSSNMVALDLRFDRDTFGESGTDTSDQAASGNVSVRDVVVENNNVAVGGTFTALPSSGTTGAQANVSNVLFGGNLYGSSVTTHFANLYLGFGALGPLHTTSWFFPGVLNSGWQKALWLAPKGSSLMQCLIHDTKIWVGTTSGSSSTWGIGKCNDAGACSSPNTIFSSNPTLAGSTYTGTKVPDAATAYWSFGYADAYKITLTPGASLADAAVMITYSCDE